MSNSVAHWIQALKPLIYVTVQVMSSKRTEDFIIFTFRRILTCKLRNNYCIVEKF